MAKRKHSYIINGKDIMIKPKHFSVSSEKKKLDKKIHFCTDTKKQSNQPKTQTHKKKTETCLCQYIK